MRGCKRLDGQAEPSRQGEGWHDSLQRCPSTKQTLSLMFACTLLHRYPDADTLCLVRLFCMHHVL